jgi:hypothetical protein
MADQWTKKEEKFLKDKYNEFSIKKLARELGRTKGAIYTRVYNMGLSEKRVDGEKTENSIKIPCDIAKKLHEVTLFLNDHGMGLHISM